MGKKAGDHTDLEDEKPLRWLLNTVPRFRLNILGSTGALANRPAKTADLATSGTIRSTLAVNRYWSGSTRPEDRSHQTGLATSLPGQTCRWAEFFHHSGSPALRGPPRSVVARGRRYKYPHPTHIASSLDPKRKMTTPPLPQTDPRRRRCPRPTSSRECQRASRPPLKVMEGGPVNRSLVRHRKRNRRHRQLSAGCHRQVNKWFLFASRRVRREGLPSGLGTEEGTERPAAGESYWTERRRDLVEA